MSKNVDHPATFIVYGVDADKKPHAARFDNSHPELVAKAAALMGFKLHKVSAPAVAALADALQRVRTAGPERPLRAAGRGDSRGQPKRRNRGWVTWTATHLGRDRPRPPGHRQRRAWLGLVRGDGRQRRRRHAHLALARLPLAARYRPASVQRRVDQTRSVTGRTAVAQAAIAGLSHQPAHGLSHKWLCHE
jgi:hypothetical protein